MKINIFCLGKNQPSKQQSQLQIPKHILGGDNTMWKKENSF